MNSDQNPPSVFAVASDSEWQFSNCPPDQLHVCDIYEHARENEAVVAMVALSRTRKMWASPGLFPDPSSALLGKALFEAFPEFPGRSFLDLDATVRAERCRRLNRIRQHIQVCIYDDPGAHKHSEGTVLMRIHRRAPRAAVMKAIGKINQERQGPQRPDKNLQYLAMTRLYKKLGSWPSVLQHLDKLGDDLSSRNVEQCSKDKAKAISNIENVLRRIV